MPLVSVIVPVYNSYSTLARCVNSVLRQTVQDLELLLVDDGSSDVSGGLCDAMAMADQRIRVFHKKTEGLLPPVTWGSKKHLAAGSYFWMLMMQ
ncbi:protein containing Glycosyl transferase, family 2 domain protein [gut metagenome]|uniref:Protein containing Glycosyl transferase, family 2 domain protein n=1 Tax=gut metagenome TaxID=749906 RepID=J9GVM1_9ZZZZ